MRVTVVVEFDPNKVNIVKELNTLGDVAGITSVDLTEVDPSSLSPTN